MLRVLRFQIRKDNIPSRQDLVTTHFRQQKYIGALYASVDHGALSFFKPFFVLLWALFHSGSVFSSKARVFFITWSPAEQKAQRQFAQLGLEHFVLDWGFSLKKLACAFIFMVHAMKHQQVLRYWLLARRLSRRYPLYIAGRGLEAVLTYVFFKHLRGDLHSSWFFISTESNPHGSALMELAREGVLHTAYWAHSPIIDNVLPIYLDVGVFWGRGCSEELEYKGAFIKNKYFFSPVSSSVTSPSDHRRQARKIIISLSKNPNWEGVEKLIEELQTRFPHLLCEVRVHPNSAKSLSQLNIQDQLSSCAFMLAGNSAVHLDALAAGVPSFFETRIESVPEKTLPFVKNGQVKTFNELKNLSLDALLNLYPASFYSHMSELYFSVESSEPQLKTQLKMHLEETSRC